MKEHRSDLEDRILETTKKSEQQNEKQILKSKDSLRDLYNSIKHTPRRGREEKGVESIFDKIIVEHFMNLKKETDVQYRK